MSLRVIYVAEIVGKAGVRCVKTLLPHLRQKYGAVFVMGNADGVTSCAGIGRNHAGYLRKLGVSAITGGDYIYYKKDMVESFGAMPYVLRPANFPAESPGRGWRLFSAETVQGKKAQIAVVSLLGQSGFTRIHSDNPFVCFATLIEHIRNETPYVVVDFHGATTAEKQAFCYYADGKVSAVFGSHGRVQTSDERILEKGTAVITDAGRTGAVDSVGGCEAGSRIAGYLRGIPEWNREAEGPGELQGVLCELQSDGTAASIERLRIPLERDTP